MGIGMDVNVDVQPPKCAACTNHGGSEGKRACLACDAFRTDRESPQLIVYPTSPLPVLLRCP